MLSPINTREFPALSLIREIKGASFWKSKFEAGPKREVEEDQPVTRRENKMEDKNIHFPHRSPFLVLNHQKSPSSPRTRKPTWLRAWEKPNPAAARTTASQSPPARMTERERWGPNFFPRESVSKPKAV